MTNRSSSPVTNFPIDLQVLWFSHVIVWSSLLFNEQRKSIKVDGRGRKDEPWFFTSANSWLYSSNVSRNFWFSTSKSETFSARFCKCWAYSRAGTGSNRTNARRVRSQSSSRPHPVIHWDVDRLLKRLFPPLYSVLINYQFRFETILTEVQQLCAHPRLKEKWRGHVCQHER